MHIYILGKDSEKNVFKYIYIYIQTSTTEKHSITNSMSERTNMLAYELPTSYAAWCPWWLNQLRLHISRKCVSMARVRNQRATGEI